MQYVGSPQTTFRFGSTPTRSMSISSLASMAESAEEPEDGDHGETAAHYFSRRFSVGSFHQRRRSGSVQSLSSMDGARAGSVGNNLSILGSSAEGHHRARPPRPGRAQSARGGMLSESLGRQHSSRSVSQSPTSSNPTSPHHSNVNILHAGHARAPFERRSSLGRAGYSPETRVVGFGEGSTTTTSPGRSLYAEEAETTRAQRAYLGASDDGDGVGDGDEESAPAGDEKWAPTRDDERRVPADWTDRGRRRGRLDGRRVARTEDQGVPPVRAPTRSEVRVQEQNRL